MSTKEIELTTAEVVNLVGFFNQENEDQKTNEKAFFNSLPNLMLWKLRRNIKTLMPTAQEFEDLKESMQSDIQIKWFDEEHSDPVEEEGQENVRRIKSEYLNEYQKVVAEANQKLNEVLEEKETYTIQTMDMENEIEGCINDIDSKNFDKIEMLMFMDNE